MHKNATKCNKTLSKWCKNKHEASKIMETLETYQRQIQYGVLDYVLYIDVYYKATCHGPVYRSAISSYVLYRHGLPATGPLDRLSAIPPPWATLACWFRTMSLVYLFGISPTVAPGELQDRHLHPLCLIPDEVIIHCSSSSCILMVDLGVPPIFTS
jgi:hypothetical protein